MTEPSKNGDRELPRSLDTRDIILLVVGLMAGSGVFVVPATTARLTEGLVGPALLVWVVGGALSLIGALTYAELGAMKPKAGGLYVFIRDAFGSLPAFLYGWMLFAVMGSGILAALSIAATSYFNTLWPLGPVGTKVLPLLMILAIAITNIVGTRGSASANNWMTAFKAAAITVLSVVLIAKSNGTIGPIWPETMSSTLAGGFGAAMLGVLWAYEGWQWVTFSVGEMVEPEKRFPRAMIGGTCAGVALYLLANIGYFAALGPEAVAASPAVAVDAARSSLGGFAARAVGVVALITILGAANGVALTIPRVFFAMARDGLFFESLGRVHPRFGTPAMSIASIAVLGALFTLWGSFDQLLSYVVFTGWIFYLLGGMAVFVLRKKQPDLHRPYRIPGYPFTPILFLLAAAAVVLNTLVTQPARASVGLGVVAIGAPIYLWWRRSAARR